jgi:putative transcriptional regulator
MRVIMGYAGWSSGQLEDEIQKNLWLVIPNALELIFNTEDDALYEAATKSIGIDIHKLSSSGGDA